MKHGDQEKEYLVQNLDRSDSFYTYLDTEGNLLGTGSALVKRWVRCMEWICLFSAGEGTEVIFVIHPSRIEEKQLKRIEVQPMKTVLIIGRYLQETQHGLILKFCC